MTVTRASTPVIAATRTPAAVATAPRVATAIGTVLPSATVTARTTPGATPVRGATATTRATPGGILPTASYEVPLSRDGIPLPDGCVKVLPRLEAQAYVGSVAWSPDGMQIAAAMWTAGGLVWPASGGTPRAAIRHSTVGRVSWAPDGHALAIGTQEAVGGAKVTLVRPDLSPLAGIAVDDDVRTFAWAPDSSRLAVVSGKFSLGTNRASVQIFSDDGRRLITFPAAVGDVYSLTWAPDGTALLIAERDGRVRRWSPDGQELTPLPGGGVHGPYVGWSRGSGTIASVTDQDELFLARADGSSIARLPLGEELTALAWDTRGQRLATATREGGMRLWGADGTPLAFLYGGGIELVTSLSWSPDGSRMVSGAIIGNDYVVLTWCAEAFTVPTP